jgi:HEAT repeat protein
MTAPVPAGDPGLLSFLFLVFASVSGVGYALRVLHRHERARAREDLSDLAQSLRDFLELRLEAGALAAQAAAADAGSFWTAIEALTSRGDGWLALSRALAGCPHLETERQALRVESPWRRELAARRLGLLFAPGSRRALRAALHEGHEVVTAAAAISLARYRDLETLRWLLAHPESLARRPHRARVALLRAFGRRGLPELAAALERGTGEPGMDRAVIEALGIASHHEARMAVARCLRQGDMEQRVAAARALGRMEAEDCATSLMGALQDDAWQVRAQAAWALGRVRAPIALLVLPARLADPAWWVRRHAAYALRELGAEGRQELEHIAHGSPDPYARDMAREVLEGWPEAA